MEQQFIEVTETAPRLMALDAELAKKFLRDYGSYANRVDIDSTIRQLIVKARVRRRVESGTAVVVEIRVIDREDAVPFGFNFQHTCILRSDPRYPVHKNDYRELILADESHNNWYSQQ